MGIAMVGSYRIQPYRVRFYPAYQTASSIGTYVFEGSPNGGKNWTTLATGQGAEEGWNYLTGKIMMDNTGQ